MAYVGNTQRLCHAIIDNDLEAVEEWLAQDGSDPNRRDYTGRTPLHLAAMVSTPAIVQCLVDHGARLIWRLADGRTALHLAAARGSVEIVKILLTKSDENEEAEEARKDRARLGKGEEKAVEAEDEDTEVIEDNAGDADDDHTSFVTGSFVDVKKEEEKAATETDEGMMNEPDIYDINVIAWGEFIWLKGDTC
jgi:ankyrin repeat protein